MSAPQPVVVDAAAAALVAAPLDPGQVLDGAPEVSRPGSRARRGRHRDQRRLALPPGRFSDVEVDETFVVLEGRATVEFEDGDRIELAAGSVCVLPAGARTVWTVHETILKGFSIRPARA